MKRNAFLGAAGVGLLWPGTAGATQLGDQIARVAAASSGVVGLYARKMSPSEPVTYNADEIFPTASIIKLVILVSLFQYAEVTPGVLAHRITLHYDDFVGGSEVLDSYNPGSSLDVETLARAMIAQSDNTASNVLISYLGFERIAKTIERAGLRKTQLKRHFMNTTAGRRSENLSTARDMGSLLYHIERGAHEAVYTVASPRSCRHMIDILLRQEDRDKIARGLPRGIPLANKTGEIDGVRNDIGIVDPYGDSPYVIAVLTKDLGDFSLGNIAIRRIASAVHSALY